MSDKTEQRAVWTDPKNVEELNKKLRQGWRVADMVANSCATTAEDVTWEGSILVIVEREKREELKVVAKSESGSSQ